MKYEYNNDPTNGAVSNILSQKDQRRMWAYASYAIEFALQVERSTTSTSSSSTDRR